MRQRPRRARNIFTEDRTIPDRSGTVHLITATMVVPVLNNDSQVITDEKPNVSELRLNSLK